jgi:hypothetical protein
LPGVNIQAALVSHVIKPIIAQESKGLFIYKEERLQKAFPFRSSFRDILLQEVNGDQILDLVLAIFLSAASPTLSDSFFQLYEDGVRGTLHLGEVFSEGIPARNAVKEVGLYLRFLPGVSLATPFRADFGSLISTVESVEISANDKDNTMPGFLKSRAIKR